MKRFNFATMFGSCGLLFVACTDDPKPPPQTSDVPVADVTDSAAPDLVDSAIDVSLDAADATIDVSNDVTDVTPVDVPPGTTWCSLPMGPDAEVRGVTLPEGFCVRRYGRLQHARVMAFSPSGDLFVASPGTVGPGGTGPGIDAIAVLPDDNLDGVADSVTPFARLPQLLWPGVGGGWCASGVCSGTSCASAAPGVNLPTGSPCTTAAGCTSGFCSAEHVCQSAASGTGAATGAACTAGSQCATGFCAAGACQSDARLLGRPNGAMCAQRVDPTTQTVHGLLLRNGYLYYTFQNSVNRVAYHAGDRAIPSTATVELVADLTGAERWTHTLAAGADGTLYVSMGIYGSFQCPYPSPERGAILHIRSAPTDTTPALNGEIVARGFRNPMYIRCQPWGCYAAELTDDGWTAPGREKIVRFEAGQDYGYPCCYDRNLPSPANGGRVSCVSTTASVLGFPVGYTPFGHDFEKGNWPAPYANGMFVGLHGQVGSWTATGINWAPANPTTHAFMSESAQQFMGGWGRGTPNEGRVADIAFAPDGRLFFTDDQQGHVYWIAPRSLQIRPR